MTQLPRVVPYVLVAILFATAGALIGHVLLPASPLHEIELHQTLHSEMVLSAQQSSRMAILERTYTDRRTALERQQVANRAELAAAIASEHRFGPNVSAAVNRSQATNSQLQRVTLEHIFAMRGLLDADQAAYFDAEIDRARSDFAQ